MSDAAIDEAAKLLARRVGLRLDHAIRARLTSAVRDEAERRGLAIGTYVTTLDGDAEALQDLLNRVTVQETAFFRDPGQFAALAADVLPLLAERGGPVNIWSAGCANGQEAYSLAMALHESDIEKWTVIASDLSTEALARSRAGRYFAREVTGLSPARRERYLEPVRDDGGELVHPPQWQVVAELRDRVHVRRHNLVAESPPFHPGACDVIFCRNVLIYFDRENTIALLGRFADWLPSDGHLFLGYSESLWDIPNDFSLVRLGEAFAYRNGTETNPAPRPDPSPRPPTSVVRSAAPIAPPPPADEPRAPVLAASTPSGSTMAAPTSVSTHELFEQGERELADGDPLAAIATFRQAVFLDHDNPLAYLHLGLALDVMGDDAAARRAFAAGRAALDRCDPSSVEAILEGYQFDDLARLLERRARPR